MSEFAVHVAFLDSKRPGKQLQKIVIIGAEDQSVAQARGGVAAIFREANNSYGGNIASFSDVNTEIVFEAPPGATANSDSSSEWVRWEDPTQRDESGRPIIYRMRSYP